MRDSSIPVTHEDIEKALARFRAGGGLIRKLPDEVVPSDASVSCEGARSFAVAEAGEPVLAPVKAA